MIDKELEKLKLLMHAMRSADNAEPLEWEQELRIGAWLLLHNRPGYDKDKWLQELSSQYPTEIIDTFGTNETQALAALANWWESEMYKDEHTGLCETYEDWSRIFANEKSVRVYDELARKTRNKSV